VAKLKEDEMFENIQRQIQELRETMQQQIQDLADTISDHLNSQDEEPKRFSLSEIPIEPINPWALQAASELRTALTNNMPPLKRLSPNPRFNTRRFEPYIDTINALKQTDEGYTAEEVSKITRRKRNTESGYLYRLYLAGYAKRAKRGKKIKYTIDKEFVDSAFGMR